MRIISDNLCELLLGQHAPLVSKCHRKVFKSTLGRAGINRQGNTATTAAIATMANTALCASTGPPLTVPGKCARTCIWDGNWRCQLNLPCPLWSHRHSQQGLEASAPRPPTQSLHHQAQDGAAQARTNLLFPGPHVTGLSPCRGGSPGDCTGQLLIPGCFWWIRTAMWFSACAFISAVTECRCSPSFLHKSPSLATSSSQLNASFLLL